VTIPHDATAPITRTIGHDEIPAHIALVERRHRCESPGSPERTLRLLSAAQRAAGRHWDAAGTSATALGALVRRQAVTADGDEAGHPLRGSIARSSNTSEPHR
jgi:hypothetical protein